MGWITLEIRDGFSLEKNFVSGDGTDEYYICTPNDKLTFLGRDLEKARAKFTYFMNSRAKKKRRKEMSQKPVKKTSA